MSIAQRRVSVRAAFPQNLLGDFFRFLVAYSDCWSRGYAGMLTGLLCAIAIGAAPCCWRQQHTTTSLLLLLLLVVVVVFVSMGLLTSMALSQVLCHDLLCCGVCRHKG